MLRNAVSPDGGAVRRNNILHQPILACIFRPICTDQIGRLEQVYSKEHGEYRLRLVRSVCTRRSLFAYGQNVRKFLELPREERLLVESYFVMAYRKKISKEGLRFLLEV